MKKITLLFATMHLGALAQTPTLLKDITPGSASSSFGEFAVLPGDNILFGVYSGTTGSSGLWVSDGSTSGTKQLIKFTGASKFADLNGRKYMGARGSSSLFCLWGTDGSSAGTDSIPLPGLQSISDINGVNGKLVFIATNTMNTVEVWASDGTAAGTHSLLALSAGKTHSVINNVLYFGGTTAAYGQELYRSDGTTAGTYMVKDVWPGAGSSFNANPIGGVYNNIVFLVMNDGSTGGELWKTDGTTAGTSLVKDIFAGTGSSNIIPFSVKTGPNGAYFMANNQTNGNELWFSDGTTANTNMIKDMNPGAGSGQVNDITFVNNHAYYMYLQSIYKTDGTAAGTTSLNVSKEYASSANHWIFDRHLRLYNNELYFLSFNKDQAMSGISDTVVFSKVDLNLSARTVVGKLRHYYPAAGGEALTQYGASTTVVGSHFIYFYRTNSDKMSVAIFNPATGQHKLYHHMGGSTFTYNMMYPLDYPPVGNKMYFPYTKNGMIPGYLDLSNDSIYSLSSGVIGYACGMNNYPFWRHHAYNVNNKSYFFASESGYGMELFGTDFTTAGTGRLKDINPGSGDFDNANQQNDCFYSRFVMCQTPSNFYFGADDGGNGFELWALYNSPGNPVGVAAVENGRALVDIFPNPASSLLNISSDTDLHAVTIFNAVGSHVKTVMPGSGKTAIDISGLVAGVYFVSIETRAGKVVKKFIKE